MKSFIRFFKGKVGLVLLALVSCALPLLQTPLTVSQPALTDIQGHWAQLCIQQLAQREVIRGYPDGSFRPNLPVTRAEFAAIVTKAFSDAPQIRSGGDFVDLPEEYWATFPIRQAYQTGFLTGYPGNLFQPSQNIPRVQVLVSLTAGLGYQPSKPLEDTLNQTFEDAVDIPDYAKASIAAATENKLVVNYPQVRQLRPNEFATRGEVAAFICQGTGSLGTVPSSYIADETRKAPPELRGVWLTNIDSEVLFDQNRLSEAIERLDQLNFNTLYPTMWNWGYTLFPSQVAKEATGLEMFLAPPPETLDTPPASGTTNSERDVLAEIITQAHRQGMAVIPWLEFGFMAPANSALVQRHPDWITQRQDGNTIWVEGDRYDRVWLNPAHPGVQKFMTDLVVEIVSRYDVDGIQFDDHFGMPIDFGYDDLTVQLYRQDHDDQFPPSNYQDAEWVQWRANQITDYLKNLFAAVKTVNSDVVISLSPNPYEFAYESYLQDWKTWERQGLIEELIVQVYRNDLERFQKELNHSTLQQARTHIPVGIGVLSGLKSRYVSSNQIQTQVKILRNQGFAGVSFFFYEGLWNFASESPQQRQSMLQTLFPTEVERPDLYRGWTGDFS